LISDSLPIRRYFSICVGMIGMSCNNFWKSSPQEIYLAIEGFVEFNGSSQKEEKMTKSRLQEMMELYPD